MTSTRVRRWRIVRQLVAEALEAASARPARSALTALGIGLGVAALVAIVGIGSASRAQIGFELNRLGTNLLVISPGQSIAGPDAKLLAEAPPMVQRVGPVQAVAFTSLAPLAIRRNSAVPINQTGGLLVYVTDDKLADVVKADASEGSIDLSARSDPVVVLGAISASQLGAQVDSLIDVSGETFRVIGVLEPVALAPELDRSALMSETTFLEQVSDELPEPSRIYLRVAPNRIDQVVSVLPRTANPEAPNEVAVSRPSDLISAAESIDSSLATLVLALGGIALIAGGVGVANVMVVAVLERRSEIGIRRALGARASDIRLQFLIEASLIATAGGFGGSLVGVLVVLAYTLLSGWTVALPYTAIALGLVSSILVGTAAGWYPASKAARVSPAQAVRGL